MMFVKFLKLKAMTIYQEVILDHAENPRNTGNIQNPTKSVIVYNPLCGDKIKMDVLIKRQSGRRAVSGERMCHIEGGFIAYDSMGEGKDKRRVEEDDKKDMMNLLKIELGANRIKCALLPLEALQKLLI